MVKPLSSQLEHVPVYAGATILGDGSVALILDVLALAQRAYLAGTGREQARPAPDRADGDRPPTGAALLVASVNRNRQVAIPLERVIRLEEIPAGSVEQVGSRELVQYGEILLLVRLAGGLGAATSAAGDALTVVVCSTGGRAVGLVVDAIVDIVEGGLPGRGASRAAGAPGAAGLLGTAVVQRRITELLDVEQAVREVDPQFFDPPAVPARGGP